MLRAAAERTRPLDYESQPKLGRTQTHNGAHTQKWCHCDHFEEADREGRPRTALTAKNLRKLGECEGKSNQSVRIVGPRLKMGKSSASRGFKELNLVAYKRPKQSKLLKRHIKN